MSRIDDLRYQLKLLEKSYDYFIIDYRKFKHEYLKEKSCLESAVNGLLVDKTHMERQFKRLKLMMIGWLNNTTFSDTVYTLKQLESMLDELEAKEHKEGLV